MGCQVTELTVEYSGYCSSFRAKNQCTFFFNTARVCDAWTEQESIIQYKVTFGSLKTAKELNSGI